MNLPLGARILAAFDCAVLATNHDAFDYKMIKQHAKIIIDTRGVYLERVPHVVKA